MIRHHAIVPTGQPAALVETLVSMVEATLDGTLNDCGQDWRHVPQEPT